MVINKKSAAPKKNKGPKGKMARAKAKLDRQWGETRDDNKTTTYQRGKTRILEKRNQRNERNQAKNEERENRRLEQEQRIASRRALKRDDEDEMSVTSNSYDEANESDTEAAPLTNLLQSIRSKKKRPVKRTVTKHNNEDEDDDEAHEMEQENNDDESDDDDEEEGAALILDDDSDGSDDDESESENDGKDSLQEGNTVDLFRQRFGQGPLSQTQLKTAHPTTTTKVAMDASLEYHVMGNDLEAILPKKQETTKKIDDPVANQEEWKRLAKEAFRGNRKILQDQWKQKQKSMKTSQCQLYPFLARYADSMVTTEDPKHQDGMHRLYMLHVLNHVLTSRSRIQRHNKQIKEVEKLGKDKGKDKTEKNKGKDKAAVEKKETEQDEVDDGKWRDQGYTRPTVLVLLPTRGTCYRFVQDLIAMAGTTMESDQAERFETDFGSIKEDGEEAPPDDEKELRRKAILEQKGPIWNELFGDDANQDDDFKMGIQLTPKAAKGSSKEGEKKKEGSNVFVKLYADFYKSDISCASPLSLKMLTTPEDEDKEGDIDYLSSIEVCLVEHSDVLLMQNWDHVNEILNLLNQEPKNNNNTDFSRVRNYMLEGQGANWRQLIVSSNIVDPSILSTFKRFAKSLSGSVKFRRRVAPEDAAIANVLVPIKQVFQRVSASSFVQQSDARLSYFTKTILPQILGTKQKHTLIYVPSYFDFCSLRNVFLKRELDFVSVTEYSRTSEVSRGRARFLQGRKPIMLYTGRCHFFLRHAIKGARHLIFFGLPEHSNFYSEQVNLVETINAKMNDEDDLAAATTVSSCLALFTKYDAHALERVVGSTSGNHMVASDKTTFMFYS